MEKKLKGFLVILGAAIMGSVAFTPLTSYAADGECTKDNPSACKTVKANQAVVVNVKGYLTLDAVSNTELIRISPNQLKTGTLRASVTSSSPFTISLSADQPNLVNTTNDSAIIAPGTSQSVSGSGWGVKKNGAASDNYVALLPNPQVFYEGPANDTSTSYPFEVGVWVDDNVQEGMYKTTVTVTAAVKE